MNSIPKKRDHKKWWYPASKVPIPIRRMTDSHLQNTIKYLDRNRDRWGRVWDWTLLWYADYDPEQLQKTSETFDALVKERSRRQERNGCFPRRCTCIMTYRNLFGVVCKHCDGPIERQFRSYLKT